MKRSIKKYFVLFIFILLGNAFAQPQLSLDLFTPNSNITVERGEEFIVYGKLYSTGGSAKNVKVWVGASTKWWDEADELIWIFSDAQPEDNPGYVDPWGRLGSCIADINSLPLTADYIIGAGDIANPSDVSNPVENIIKTHEYLNRISWFKSKPEDGAAIVVGNHEWGYVSEFSKYFGPSDDADRLFSVEFGNFIIYALAFNDNNNDYTTSLKSLKKELEKLKKSGVKKNILLTFHFTIAHSVNNCHYLPDAPNLEWGRPALFPDDLYEEITKEFGGEYISAVFTGDIHGSWKDPGTTPQSVRNNILHVNTGVFGDRGVHSNAEGVCYPDDDGLGESQFMAIKHGEKFATLYKRQSWYDREAPDGGGTDIDGEKEGEGINDIIPHWFDEEGFPWTINPEISNYSKENYQFPLAQPAVTPTRKVIARSETARFLTSSKQPATFSNVEQGQVKNIEWKLKASPNLEPGEYTLNLKVYSDNVKAVESKNIIITVK